MKSLNKKNIVKFIYSLKSSFDNYITTEVEKTGVKGLAVSHGNILVRLYEKDKQPMTKIAEDIGKCKSTLTVLVNKLEKAEFVQRVSDENDTRIKKLALTDKGRDFQESFWKISDNLNDLLWEDFTEEEKKTFVRLLEKMSTNLKNSKV